jgi:hypothetical protein
MKNIKKYGSYALAILALTLTTAVLGFQAMYATQTIGLTVLSLGGFVGILYLEHHNDLTPYRLTWDKFLIAKMALMVLSIAIAVYFSFMAGGTPLESIRNLTLPGGFNG